MAYITNYSKFYETRKLQWSKIRHVLEGEDQIKIMGKAYLPQPSGMNVKEFNNYKERAMFYGVCERTQRGMVGMIYRKSATVELPEKLKPLLLDTTVDGHTFDMFLDEITRELLTIGRYGVLLDYAVNAGPNDLPRLCTYMAEDITNWEQIKIDGEKKTSRVILRDRLESELNTGDEEFLELTLVNGVYTSQRFKYDKVTAMNIYTTLPVTPFVNGKVLDYIPFTFINPYDMRPEIEKPPFLDLANMNLAHYRNSADYEHALYMTAQPTPWVAGVMSEESKPKTIGPSVIWYLTENGKAGLLEFTGKGLEAQQQAMKDKEDRMAALGARMIAENANRNETVDTARLRGRGEMSLLLSVVQTIQAAVNKIFMQAAVWSGLNPAEVKITINRDFVETRMSHQEITALVLAWQAGAVSRTSLHENFQRGEIIAHDRTSEEETAEIEKDDLRVPVVVPGPSNGPQNQ